jgi:tRNA(Ile2) C34 agmatinyltransferase TiaS
MKKSRSAPNGAKHPPPVKRFKEARGIVGAPATIPVGALKLKPAAQYVGGLSVPTMHRLIQRGLLKPNRATRHLLFPVSELDRFLRSNMS